MSVESRVPARPLRVGIVADLLEESWPSMDLVAEMMLAHLPGQNGRTAVHATLVRPSFPRRGARLLSGRESGTVFDRFVHRFWDYPRWLRRHLNGFDLFHVVDHSYAHLVHVLPASRTIVTCHDIDAFLPIVQPRLTASKLPAALTRRVLSGMQKAACIVCDSAATCLELRQHKLVDASRLVVVHLGVKPGYSPAPDSEADRWAAENIFERGRSDASYDLLHVGSTIPRKRIDLLLQVFAAVHERQPAARLLRVGGEFTAEQADLVRSLGLADDIVTLPPLSTAQLAAVYRRACVLLMTSEREGFGFPVVEAMACGTPVVATDLPVLREVGGTAAAYCGLGDVAAWQEAILGLLRERSDEDASRARRAMCLDHASRFRWTRYADAMAEIYRHVSARHEAARAATPARAVAAVRTAT